MNNTTNITDECPASVIESRPDEFRFVVVAIVGNCIATIAFFNNVLLFGALLAKQENRQTNFVYLIFLALGDICVSALYVPLIGWDVLRYYLPFDQLFRIWSFHFTWMLAVCQVAMTTSAYLLVVATFERYLITIRSAVLDKIKGHRLKLMLGCLLWAIVLKGSAIFETKAGLITETIPGVSPSCLLVFRLKYQPAQTDLVKAHDLDYRHYKYWYNTVYKFYFRNIFSRFVPFGILLILNLRIIMAMHRQMRQDNLMASTDGGSMADKTRKRKMREATRVLVLVVCCYLMANVLDVIITFIEYIDNQYFFADEEMYNKYEKTADFVSVFTVLACMLRLPIYWFCNSQMRQVIKDALRCGYHSTQRPPLVTANDDPAVTTSLVANGGGENNGDSPYRNGDLIACPTYKQAVEGELIAVGDNNGQCYEMGTCPNVASRHAHV